MNEVTKFLASPSLKKRMSRLGYVMCMGFENVNVPLKLNAGGGSYTDGKSVTVGVPDNYLEREKSQWMIAIKALIAHEYGHLRVSDFNEIKRIMNRCERLFQEKHQFSGGGMIAKNLLNAVEDGRMERLQSTKFPGMKKYIMALNIDFWENFRHQGCPPTQSFMMEVCTLSVLGVHGKDFETVYPKGTPMWEAINVCKPYIKRGVNANNPRVCTNEVIEMIKQISSFIADVFTPESIQDLPNNDEFTNDLNQEGDQSEGQASNSPHLSEMQPYSDDTSSDDSSANSSEIKDEEKQEEETEETNDSEGSNGMNDESKKEEDSENETGEGNPGENSEEGTSNSEENLEKNSESDGKDSETTSEVDSNSDISESMEKELEKIIEEMLQQLEEELEEELEQIEKEEKELEKVGEREEAERAETRLEREEVLEAMGGFISGGSLDGRPIERNENAEMDSSLKRRGKRFNKDLSDIFMNKRGYQRTNQRSGMLDTSNLWRMEMKEKDLFIKKGDPIASDYAAYVLVDQSGSMDEVFLGKSAMKHAKEACTLLEEGLKGIMPLKIVRFSGMDIRLSHRVVKDWLDNDKKRNYSNEMRATAENEGNCDGVSIKLATTELLKRKESKKILFVVSDGMPTVYNSQSEGIAHVKKVVTEARKNGILVVPIRIGNERFLENNLGQYVEMYERDILSCHPDEIQKNLMKVLKKIVR